MWRLYHPLLALWSLVGVGLLVAVAANYLFADANTRTQVLSTLGQVGYVLAAMVSGLVLATVVARRHFTRKEDEDRKSDLAKQFDFLKPCTQLLPQDLGFDIVAWDTSRDQLRRPFDAVYIPRRAVEADSPGAPNRSRKYVEDELVSFLRDGKGLVLLGQPTEGKTRTLYEIVRRLTDHLVVRPGKEFPTDDAFALAQGRRVVMLVDDLNEHANPGSIDLRAFRTKLLDQCETLVVATTCRGGSELGVVAKNVDGSLARFYEDIPVKLRLVPVTADEKARLARDVGVAWKPEDSNLFPTPGFITMKKAFDAQRTKFIAFGRDRPELQAILRALKLLVSGGVLPVTHQRLGGVLRDVLRCELASLGPSLSILTTEHFLRPPPQQDPCQTEPAYLLFAVDYQAASGGDARDDFPALQATLRASADAEGLFYLGNTLYGSASSGRHAEAIAAYDQALQFSPDFPEALNNKGNALSKLGRYAEAIDAYDRAIERRPDYPEALNNRAFALSKVSGDAEKIAAPRREAKPAPRGSENRS